jgi:hypothetical protein
MAAVVVAAAVDAQQHRLPEPPCATCFFEAQFN